MRTTSPTARRWAAPVAVLAAATFTLAGCGASDDDQAGTPSPTPTLVSTPTSTPPTPGASTEPTSPPTSAPTGGAFTAPGTELSQLPQDGRLTVVDVRIGVHDGYERVVYELAGEGLPGWRVGYVDEAVDDPSGEVLDVAGDATLQVVLLGTAYPMDTGHDELDHDVMGTGGVQQVTRPLTFEGQTQSFVGLDAQRPVRITLLADPVRVVVDLQTP
ncbi:MULTISPECIES: AMIN-like domain-containing (lipo)protein [Cellulomonas]|uniref:AMIN-like domain-containing protein n=1 Tax=Cellulomonas gelida TaxID=1712 RepID=A0A4Y3KGE1_9CELL|nr:MULTISPECIES: hypothetical protein [Cellulomonas]GEA83042.1 hypothetical protein CGE01nite_02930 [Cellulomonas gelida]GGL30644.1 hypothetical protein GCM10009774_21250 [Cellulomonas gelida]